MDDRDWLDDYMEMKLATGDDEDGGDSTPTQNSGCLPVVGGILVLLALLRILF